MNAHLITVHSFSGSYAYFSFVYLETS
uniref:Uncharacterized protein n=1 Tax=Anguilla anguilla TaxID=7936 RepID=A0A0E9TC75_ANGAN